MGGADADSIDVVGASQSLIRGDNGGDSLELAAALTQSTIEGGAGADQFTDGAAVSGLSNSTISAGAGGDSLDFGSALTATDGVVAMGADAEFCPDGGINGSIYGGASWQDTSAGNDTLDLGGTITNSRFQWVPAPTLLMLTQPLLVQASMQVVVRTPSSSLL